MRKIIINVFLLLFLLSACDAPTEQPISSEQQRTPQPDDLATTFSNEEEFQNQIRTKKMENKADDVLLNEIDYYLRLKETPEGAFLKEIAVKQSYVTIQYTFDEEKDYYTERKIIITWKRGFDGTEYLKNMSEKLPSEYVHYEADDREFYIREINRDATDETGAKIEGETVPANKMVFWRQGDYAFSSVFPVWYSDDEIIEMLQVEKVLID